MTQTALLSIYGSHDASIATFVNGEYTIYELERFTRKRYCSFTTLLAAREVLSCTREEFKAFLSYIKSQLPPHITIKTSLFNELAEEDKTIITSVFGPQEFIFAGHHLSHAACAFFQSPFPRSLIFSFDGGGRDHDGVHTFRAYIGDRPTSSIVPVPVANLDLGNAYSLTAAPIKEIKAGSDNNFFSLSYAGKLMGLCAYGKMHLEWVPHFIEFYNDKDLNKLSAALGIHLGLKTQSGQFGFDLAATAQFVFEELALSGMLPLINQHKLPVCLTGGCALNVLFNQRLKELLESQELQLYIPPNPNDCGLSLGQLLLYLQPKQSIDITYRGFDILDRADLPRLVNEYNATKSTPHEVAKLLSEGKIVGIIQGRSECGPRALGNRSIVCDPSFKDMKNILNAKVKFREWFRPFAPVTHKEDASKYFEFSGEAQYMSFAPKVRIEYREKLSSIVHVDGTARLQTVTREQHSLFYDIIAGMKSLGREGVILNTSFNIKGKPILTTLKDALSVLDTTDLDYVYAEGYLFQKKL